MRGKKADPEFVSQFIARCTQTGIQTTEEMVRAAKNEIQNIDDKIIQVEKLKVVRSKLLDVITSLDKPEAKADEARLLPFFQMEYPQTCRKICKEIIHLTNISPDKAYSVNGIKDPEILFCLKQLTEAKIIARVGDALVRGVKFNDYVEFVLREV